MEITMYLPIALIVFSNLFYAVCSKETPHSINPLASLVITYIVAAIFSGILFFLMNKGGSLKEQYQHLNCTSFVLGFAIVGLEFGSILMYKVGWNVNSGQMVSSTFLAILLIFVGYFLYHESITPSKIAGIVICLIGLYFINK